MDILSLTSTQPVSVETLGRPVATSSTSVDPTDKAPPGSNTTGAASQKEAPRAGQKAPENLLDLLKGLIYGNNDESVGLSLGDLKLTASLKQVSLPPRTEDLVQALAALGVQLPPVLTGPATSQGAPGTWVRAIQQANNLPQAVKGVLSVLIQQAMAQPLPASQLIDLGRPAPAPVPAVYPVNDSSTGQTPPDAGSDLVVPAGQPVMNVFETKLVPNPVPGLVLDSDMVEALNLTSLESGSATDLADDLVASIGRPSPTSVPPPDRTQIGPMPGEHRPPSPTSVPPPDRTQIGPLPGEHLSPSPTVYGSLGRPVTGTGTPPDQFVDGFKGTAVTGGSNVVPGLDGRQPPAPLPADHVRPRPTSGNPPDETTGKNLIGPVPVDGSSDSDVVGADHRPSPTIYGTLPKGKPSEGNIPPGTIVPNPGLEYPVEAAPPTATSGKFLDIEPKPFVIDDNDSSVPKLNDGTPITLGRPDQVANVKPAPNHIPLPPDTLKSVANQIADRIETMVLGKKSGSVTVRLNPMDLGTITLTVKSFGTKVDTSIQASHDDVRAALHSHRLDLVQNVESRGLSLNSFLIGQDTSGSNRHHGHQAGQTETDRNAHIRQAVGRPSVAPVAQSGTGRTSSTGVDYLI